MVLPGIPQGETRVIKLNFLYFAVHVQKYYIKCYKISSNYFFKILRPGDLAFCTPFPFPGQFCEPKLLSFLPHRVMGFRVIVFTHGVWMGIQVGDGKKFVWAVSQKP